MYVQVIEFEYDGDVDGFKVQAEGVAPVIAAMDGLVAKLWLGGDGRRFGGVYLWSDQPAAKAYERSELFTTALVDAPEVRNLTIRGYPLWAAPTAVTSGGPVPV